MQGLPGILFLFRYDFDKFNNTGARMLDSIYHMTLKLLNIAILAQKVNILLPSLCNFLCFFSIIHTFFFIMNFIT